ncbi:MAG: AAA-like domain-containing protein [Synechococcales cyanobacterium M58_A2018_015]|nr:AAA-like domain-containing protein [Synechococcales cyanobacterium M58_A2018_015]
MPVNRPPHRRRRGVILSAQGLEKFLAARAAAELQQNGGNRYTLEQLSEHTQLSVDTLVRMLKAETGVDKETLKSCFRAFQLTLEPEDYTQPNLEEEVSAAQILEPELPGGQVSLNSLFYVERAAAESSCYKMITQPGALIRIKAPRQMGKTSLIARILHQAEQLGYRTLPLSFQLADRTVLQNLDLLLRWLCVNVTLGLHLPDKLSDYWHDALGSKISTKVYFEQYLLANSPQPIVLSLDELDQVFQSPELANEFLGLLRTWHEAAKSQSIWKQLRLIIAYSSETALPTSLNQSPLNVGLPIELKPFTVEQVHWLVQRYGFTWTLSQVTQLTTLVQGHPYLVQLALYRIWCQDLTLEQLLQTPLADIEWFRDCLPLLQWQSIAPEWSERLTVTDPASPEYSNQPETQLLNEEATLLPEIPEGSVKLGSRFYIERAGETRCYQAIAKPGALIRIKAPRQMGKTSLMTRIVDRASQLGYRTVRLNLRQAEETALGTLDRFLRWFSACISQKLQRPAHLDNYWDPDRGSIFNCTTYVQDHLLEAIESPLVLALDEVDCLFQVPDVAQGFFSMLRIWHEEAKTLDLWEQLRLVVAHSTEDYGRLDINQSPFNVGLPVELGEFTPAQVATLVEAHALPWGQTEIAQLMALVGGHPYLIRWALYQVICHDLPLEQLLAEATTQTGIYEDHLRRHWLTLQQSPDLALAVQQTVSSIEPVRLPIPHVYRLYSMGLIQRQGDLVAPRCELYRRYFQERL